jgi:cytochrome c oxidase subunit 2
VQLTLASQDVIHSFYMPAFPMKQDPVPGRNTKIYFEATKVGSITFLRRILRRPSTPA